MSEPVRKVKQHVRLTYTVRAGRDQTDLLRAIESGRFIGKRCPECTKVYCPPRGSCPTCGVFLGEIVPLPDTGTVTTFCIVNVPYEGQQLELPYIYANVLLDGADIAFPALIQGIAVNDARMGLRVRAEWLPPEERTPSMLSIRCFRPTGEPDAAFASYQEHL